MNENNIDQIMAMVRQKYEPSVEDQTRVYQGVIATVLPTATVATQTAAKSFSIIKGGAALLTVAALITSIVVYQMSANTPANDSNATRDSKTPLVNQPAATPPQSAATNDAASSPSIETKMTDDSTAVSTETAPAVKKSAVSPKKAVASKTNPHHLSTNRTDHGPSDAASEITLISSASKSINTGQYHKAMRVLRQHRSQFPAGMMSQERDGLEIITLCKQGKMNVANDKYQQFKQRSPNAPISIRIESTCTFK